MGRFPAAFATLLVLMLAPPARAEELLVIANPSVGLPAPMTLPQVQSAYLLRVTTWPDGAPIIPVNRELASAERDKFTSDVLKADTETLSAYWNELHFQGKLPPLIQESEQAMLAFVRQVPGAIGYVSASAKPSGVIVVAHVP
jgi:ABC-type phosphate transport system substrate-binding protein